MSLMSVTWTLFKSPDIWDNFDLCKRDSLLKFIGKFKYLGMEDLPQKLLVEISSINMESIEN